MSTSTHGATLDADVAIVGAGPVGARARDPARAARTVGRRPRAWPEPYPLPRAVHFDHEVGRILQSCGIGDELRGDLASRPRSTSGATRAGTTLLRFGRVGDRRVGLAVRRRCSASPSSRRCSSAGRARCRRSRSGAASRSTALEQHDDDVVVARRRRRRRPRRATSSGCDGANSTVRDLLGVDGRRPRVLLRLADRRRHPRRAARVRSDQPPDLRSGRPDDRGVGRARPPALGVHAPARRDARRARRRSHARGSCSRRGTCTPATRASNGTRSTRSRPAYAEQWRAGRVLPRRRRRAPDAAVRRPGHVLRRPRRGQPRVEARPRARRPRARRAARHLRRRSGGRARAGDRVLDGARQGHLRARPRRGRGARRGDGRGASTGELDRGARAARASTTGVVARRRRRTPGSCSSQGTVGGRRFDDVHGAGWRLVTVDADADGLDAEHARRGSSRSAGASSTLADARSGVTRAGSPSTTRRAALQRPDFHLYGTAAPTAGAADARSPTCATLRHRHRRLDRSTIVKLANHRRPRRARPRRRDRRRRRRRPAAASVPTRWPSTTTGTRSSTSPPASPRGTAPLVEADARLPGARAAPGVRHRAQLPQPRRGVRHGRSRRCRRRSRSSRRRSAGPFDDVEIVGDTRRLGGRARRRHRHAAPTASPRPTPGTHVAGLTVGQDISDRHLQFAAGAQFSLGKSRRGYGPMGPWLVTLDEVADPDDLALGCSVDGETVQDARTSDLIFGVPRLVAELSAVLPAAARRRHLHRHARRRRHRPPAAAVPRSRARSLETWIEGIGTIRNRCV